MKIRGNTVGTTMPRANWNQTDPRMADFVIGKETVDAAVARAQEAAAGAKRAAEDAQRDADQAQTAAGNAQTTADKALSDARSRQPQHQSKTLILSADGWVGNSQTVAVEDLGKDDTVISTPAPESYDLYVESGVKLSAQSDGALTYVCEDVPGADLTVGVSVFAAGNSGSGSGEDPEAEEAFQFRGRINDLGYTALRQCAQTGFYTFTTAYVPNLSDLPEGWTTGGCVITLPYEGSVWQWIVSTTKRYVRASFTGSWYPDVMVDKTLAKSGYAADAKTVGDKLKALESSEGQACYVRYNTGSYAKSDARLMIYLQQPVGFLNIDMRHYAYNTDKGVADCWGIDNAYAVDFDAANNKSTQRFVITKDGEWEMAVRLKDAADFSGGGTHGDEKNSTVVMFIDGMKKNFSDITTVTKFTELKLIQKSDVYSPTEDGNSGKIAEHGTQWIYTKDGVTISQYLRWVGAHEVGNTFLAMFPVRKTATYNGNTINVVDTGFSNADFSEYTFTSDRGTSFPDANAATVYSAESGLHCVVTAQEYPAGLPGGDKITEADNGGQNYYKLYWPVTSSASPDVAAYTTKDGEIWKSRVHYQLTLGEASAS